MIENEMDDYVIKEWVKPNVICKEIDVSEIYPASGTVPCAIVGGTKGPISPPIAVCPVLKIKWWQFWEYKAYWIDRRERRLGRRQTPEQIFGKPCKSFVTPQMITDLQKTTNVGKKRRKMTFAGYKITSGPSVSWWIVTAAMTAISIDGHNPLIIISWLGLTFCSLIYSYWHLKQMRENAKQMLEDFPHDSVIQEKYNPIANS